MSNRFNKDKNHWIHDVVQDGIEKIKIEDRSNNRRMDLTFTNAAEFGLDKKELTLSSTTFALTRESRYKRKCHQQAMEQE